MNKKVPSTTPSAPMGHLPLYGEACGKEAGKNTMGEPDGLPIKGEVAERPKGVLRALEPEDLPLLYTIENDPDMWDVGATATPYSRHALRHHIQAMGADINESGELRFVIECTILPPKAPSTSPKGESLFPPHPSTSPKGESPKSDCPPRAESSPLGGIRGGLGGLERLSVGLIDLTHYDARALRAEVSIALLREYREQGIGLEALRLLEHHCRRYLHLHQLYALVPEGNTASATLFRSAGFTPLFDIPDWHFTNEKYVKVTFFQKIL